MWRQKKKGWQSGQNRQNRQRRGRHLRTALFLLPNLSGVLLFSLLPFALTVLRSFQNVLGSGFVGIANYRNVLNNRAYLLAMRNTVRFMALCIPLLVVSSLVAAVLLDGLPVFRNTVKYALLLPWAVPAASVVPVWRILFSGRGLINGLLARLGFAEPDWMNTPMAFYVLVASYLWKNLGYDMVLWLAGLSGISTDIYEAARVDGAGAVRCFFSITLPNLRTSFFTICVMSVLNAFKVFREAYLVAGDYPHQSMYLLQHLYNNWFRDLSFDRVAAAAVMQAAVVLTLCAVLQRAIGGREDG